MKIKSLVLSVGSILSSFFLSMGAWAQAATPQQVPASAAQPAGPSPWINVALIGGMILFMWLFVFRPQSKRAKEQREFLSSLTPGYEVITSGGIIGTIVEVKENIVSLNIGSSTVRVLKSSISGKLDQASNATPAK